MNWELDGREVRRFGTEDGGRPRSRPQNTEVYFEPAVSWSDVTIGPPSFRIFPAGYIHDAVGHSAFGGDPKWKLRLLAYCNTHLFREAAQLINPTVHFHVGYFEKLPYAEPTRSQGVESTATACVTFGKSDWDAYERSWDFQSFRYPDGVHRAYAHPRIQLHRLDT